MKKTAYNWKKAQLAKAPKLHKFVPDKPVLEKDIQKTIVTYLKLVGIKHTVSDASRWGKGGGATKVDPDHPDLTCVLPVFVTRQGIALKVGLALFIEVKTPQGRVSEGQRVRLIALADAGAVCVVARTLQEVQDVVKLFKDRELDADLLDKQYQLLKLKLSDRRSREVRTALSDLEHSLSNSKKENQ